MPPIIARRLVIDTNIASSASEKNAPSSKECREFLEVMLFETSHLVVMTPELRDEWDKHQSRYTAKWQRSMIARKRMVIFGSCFDSGLRNKIENAVSLKEWQDAVEKDCILVEAGLTADKIIISRDAVRDLFAKASQVVKELRVIVWINPDKQNEEPLKWLKNGARAEKERKLGYIPKP